MHVLFLSSWFPSKKFPLNGDFVERHAKAVASMHQVTVIYVESIDGILMNERIEEEIWDLKIIRIYYPRPQSTLKNYWTKWRLYQAEIAKIIDSVSIIHTNVIYPIGFVAIWAKWKYKKPFVVTEHWTAFLDSGIQKFNKTQKIFIQYIAKRADYLLPVSQDLKNSMQKMGLKSNYQVIPNVVDTTKFPTKTIRKSTHFTFLHISHLGYQKNVEGMLNTAKRLFLDGYNFKFIFAGSGDLKPINDFVESNRLNEIFTVLGSQTSDEVSVLMQNSDCFVLFSRYENQPCVQIESFSSGTPVIASDVGGIKEYFPLDAGILVEANNENALYQAMVKMMETKDFADAEDLHKFAEDHFSIPVIASQFSEIYQKVLEK